MSPMIQMPSFPDNLPRLIQHGRLSKLFLWYQPRLIHLLLFRHRLLRSHNIFPRKPRLFRLWCLVAPSHTKIKLLLRHKIHFLRLCLQQFKVNQDKSKPWLRPLNLRVLCLVGGQASRFRQLMAGPPCPPRDPNLYLGKIPKLKNPQR